MQADNIKFCIIALPKAKSPTFGRLHENAFTLYWVSSCILRAWGDSSTTGGIALTRELVIVPIFSSFLLAMASSPSTTAASSLTSFLSSWLLESHWLHLNSVTEFFSMLRMIIWQKSRQRWKWWNHRNTPSHGFQCWENKWSIGAVEEIRVRLPG